VRGLNGAEPHVRRRLVFLGLMVGLLVSELDATVFSTAMPTIVGELHGMAHMSWITTAYVLAATVVMPVYGKLGDQLGRRRLFVAALSIFVAGSVVGGLSTGMPQLITGRVVQGLGGGGLLVLVQAIVADLVPARRRAPYMSVIGAVFALAAIAGPVVGGVFADGIGWRWAFWINIPLGGCAILVALTLLPRSRPVRERTRIDVGGIVAMAVGVTAVVLLTSEAGTRYPWSSPMIVAPAVVALVAAGGFVMLERRALEPIIALHLFGNRNFALVTCAGLTGAVAVFGVVTYLPTYLQMVAGLSAARAGMTMLCLVAGIGSATLGCAQIVSRTGHYKWLPVAGSVAVTAAIIGLSTLDAYSGLQAVAVALFVFGAGMGCVLETLVLVAQNSSPADEVGSATAVHAFVREIGVSLGTAVVGTVFTSRLAHLLAAGPVTDRRFAAGLDGVGPAELHRLTGALRTPIVAAYHGALTSTFLTVVPLMLVSAVALTFVRPQPLATTVEGAEASRRSTHADAAASVPV